MLQLPIRLCTLADRASLRDFVCRVHLDASSPSPDALRHQIEDLPTDFPALFSDKAFSSQCVAAWIAVEIDGEGKERITGAAGLTLEEEDSKEGCVHLNFLFVDKALRGQRLGPRLLETALEEARRRGFAAIRLLTLDRIYARAIALYARQGFAEYKPAFQANGHYLLRFLEKRFDEDAAAREETPLSSPPPAETWDWPGRSERIAECIASLSCPSP